MRRTITLPDTLDRRVRELAAEDESFSAAVARLIEAGLADAGDTPAWIGSGESGDPGLALRVEEVLAELAAASETTE